MPIAIRQCNMAQHEMETSSGRSHSRRVYALRIFLCCELRGVPVVVSRCEAGGEGATGRVRVVGWARACMTMLNLKSVACRIAARPSTQLRYPAQAATKALGELAAQGVGASPLASDPALSTASVCGHTNDAPAENGSAVGAAAAGAGAGVPAGVAVGTQARERSFAGKRDGGATEAMEVTGETTLEVPGSGGGASAALEPGTPNDTSDPEDPVDEVCALTLQTMPYIACWELAKHMFILHCTVW